jgi:hypothetical protein
MYTVVMVGTFLSYSNRVSGDASEPFFKKGMLVLKEASDPESSVSSQVYQHIGIIFHQSNSHNKFQ